MNLYKFDILYWQDKFTGSLLKANTSSVSPLKLAGLSVTRNHQNGTGFMSREGRYFFVLHSKGLIYFLIYEYFFVYYCCRTVFCLNAAYIHRAIYIIYVILR